MPFQAGAGCQEWKHPETRVICTPESFNIGFNCQSVVNCQISINASCAKGAALSNHKDISEGRTSSPDRATIPSKLRSETATNDVARIERALAVVATLTSQDPTYLPVFLRLEQELEDAVASRTALDRAKSLANLYNPSQAR